MLCSCLFECLDLVETKPQFVLLFGEDGLLELAHPTLALPVTGC